MPPQRFLSHYKIDARRNRLMILSCNAEDMLLPRSHFTFYGTYILILFRKKNKIRKLFLARYIIFIYILCLFAEFDTNFKLVQRREFTIPEHLMIHDWGFTDSHYILFGNRIKLDITGN